MGSFRVAAISTAVAESVRSTQKAPGYGFPAHKEVAAGRAPCRHCLGLIKVNEEELYLFDYDPFCELGVPPLPGPVYVHARDCERHNGGGAFPEEYHGRLLTLDAYGEDRTLVTEVDGERFEVTVLAPEHPGRTRLRVIEKDRRFVESFDLSKQIGQGNRQFHCVLMVLTERTSRNRERAAILLLAPIEELRALQDADVVFYDDQTFGRAVAVHDERGSLD
jgi:hypothetical protein